MKRLAEIIDVIENDKNPPKLISLREFIGKDHTPLSPDGH